MLERIPDAREVVVERTGHMLRYSHPVTYGAPVRAFLEDRMSEEVSMVCA
jgi:hypothetical protein